MPAAARSSAATSWQTPLRECTPGPPRSSIETRSPSAASTIFGPVRNIRADSVITTKSVSAGE